MHQNLPASYEAALDELQKILENIENQAVSLDVITDKAQRARFLIEHCRNKLRKIEEDTEQLLQV
jgi:exodeoxyribonuclease VII small subunit